MRLEGKKALVTGGSRGIGRACVAKLAAEGAKVAFVYHSNKESADSLVAELKEQGYDVTALQADVADAAAVEALVNKLVAKWERVDILVNSAGVIRDGLVAMMTQEDWATVINTNLGGTFNFCRYLTQQMMSQRSGSIINLSSVAAEFASSGQVKLCRKQRWHQRPDPWLGERTGPTQGSRQRRLARHDRNRHERSGSQRGRRSNQKSDSDASNRNSRGHCQRGSVPRK